MKIDDVIAVAAIEKRIHQECESLGLVVNKLEIDADPIRVLISVKRPDGELYATFERGPLASGAVVSWLREKFAVRKPVNRMQRMKTAEPV